MDPLLMILIGFALGFGLIFLIRLGQGKTVNCRQCGQKHWVGPKKTSPVCKKCGAPLNAGRGKTGKTARAGRKKNK